MTSYVRFLPFSAFLLAGALKTIPAIEGVPVDFTVAMAVVVLLQIGHELVRRSFRVPNAVAWVSVLFVTLWPATIWTNWAAPYSQEKISRLFTLTLLAMIASVLLLRTRDDLQRLVYVTAGLGLVAAYYAAIAGPGIDANEYVRLAVTDDSGPLLLGRAAAMATLTLTLVAIERGGRWAVAALVVMAPAVYSLVLAGAQGPVVGAIAGLALTLFIGRGPSRRWVRAALLGAVLLGTAVWSLQIGGDFRTERLLTIGSSEHARVRMYVESLTVIARDPLGVGWGGFAQQVQAGVRDTFHIYPHNVIIETFMEAGWLAGGTMVAVIGVGVKRMWAVGAHAGRLLVAATVFWLTQSMVSGDVNGAKVALAFVAAGLVAPSLSSADRAVAASMARPETARWRSGHPGVKTAAGAATRARA